MAWIYLIIAGFGEVGFVLCMKLSEGFSRIPYTILTIISGFFSFYFLSMALLVIPIGTGYAIWTGIGAAGSVIIGMIFFKESKDWKRLLFISMIISGVVGLKVIGS
ncbi:multidrug efflux SMR transporter [Cytobacillus spongiae]|jgi:quaternary ammonium compound-resistance protein SugE|uniref:DMT family transporter n=1 Tax=Cytobacillus spongiae TaxID=2901381 RepID=UPI001F208187|nr:multidrug efflux SMR transporter [Cytobacillus spongiae]UII56195.1 multidrug efflux SMR transporter [Cytobacillus spongiae]